MIYTLTVTAVSGHYLEQGCVRTLEIDESAVLEDLHLAIQDAVSFGNDHPDDFYAGRHYRSRKIQYADAEHCVLHQVTRSGAVASHQKRKSKSPSFPVNLFFGLVPKAGGR